MAITTPSFLTATRREGALILSLDSPKLTLDLANALYNSLKNATTDRSVRAVCLHGSSGVFMEGVDMTAFRGDFVDALDLTNQRMHPWNNAIRELVTMEKPIVTILEGSVVGSGLALALVSDLSFAADTATFQPCYLDHAMTPDGGVTWLLPRRVGLTRAAEILLCNSQLTAHKAEELGLVTRIYPSEDLYTQAFAILDTLAQGPTRALGGTKILLHQSFQNDLNQQLGLEHSWFGAMGRSFDMRECMRAIATGKAPRYGGS